MRRIPIKNLNEQKLLHFVQSFRNQYAFLISKETYEFLKDKAEQSSGSELNFVTSYGDTISLTTIRFGVFCDKFYILENITANNNLLYGYSNWTDSAKKQIVIEAE